MTGLAFTSGTPTLAATANSIFPSFTYAATGGMQYLQGILNIKTTGAGFLDSGYRATTCGYVPSANDSGGQPTGTIYMSTLFPSGTTLVADGSNPIEAALTEVAAYNAANNVNHRLKIRLSAGIRCPAWMKTSTYGGSFVIVDPTGDVSGTQTCPCFWTKAFQDEFYALMAILATKYDTNPLIAEIVANPNMTYYCEPCLRQNANSGSGLPNVPGSTTATYNPNGAVMLGVGYRAGSSSIPYSDIYNQLAHQGKMKPLWLNTVIAGDYNPYQNVDHTNPQATTATFTNGSVVPGTLTGTNATTTQPVALNDDIILIDSEGSSQIFQCAAAKTSGAITIKTTDGSGNPVLSTLKTGSSFTVFNVQPKTGASSGLMAWPFHSDASDLTTTELFITNDKTVNPFVSAENDSTRQGYVGGTQDINNMYKAMDAIINPANVGIQTAQGPAFNTGSGDPSNTSINAVLSGMATGWPANGMPAASHVEMFCPYSVNVGGTNVAKPDWTGHFYPVTGTGYVTVAQIKTLVTALYDPIQPVNIFGYTGSLPPGMALNSSTGVLNGTPNTAGSFTFTPTVTKGNNTVSGSSTTVVISGSGGGGGTSVLFRAVGACCRKGWASIPSTSVGGVPWRGPLSGINGVVTQVNFGALMPFTPAALATLTAGNIPAVTDTNFATDLAAMVAAATSGSGTFVDALGLDDLRSDIQNVDNNLANPWVKMRIFTGVQSAPANSMNPPNQPPSPSWLIGLCGQFPVSDPQSGSVPFWVSGTVQAIGDKVLGLDGNQWKCITAYTTSNQSSNTVEPSTGNNSHYSNVGLGPYAGPCPIWFGQSAAKYKAAWGYLQLLLANIPIWVSSGWTKPGDGGTWTIGIKPGGTAGTQFTLDTCPMLCEVPMTACCSIYGETGIRQIKTGIPGISTQNNASYLGAGYTFYSGLDGVHAVWSATHHGIGTAASPAPDSDVGAIMGCQEVQMAAWKFTTVSEAFQPQQYQGNCDKATSGSDPDACTTLINNLISAGATVDQAVVGNNNFNSTQTFGSGVLPKLIAAKPPVYGQTDSNLAGTVQQVINELAGAGGINIELPNGFQTGLAPSDLLGYCITWLGWMTAGTGPPGSGPPNYTATTTQPLPNPTVYSTSNARTGTVVAPTFTNLDTFISAAVVGTTYSFAPTVSPAATSWSASNNLPPGLALDVTTGILSGDPTTAGTYNNIIITATNAGGSTPSNALTIVVTSIGALPIYVLTDPPDANLGDSYAYQITVSNPTGVTFALNPSSGSPLIAAAGLSFDTSTGVISGTISGIPQTYSFTITATNSFGSQSSDQISITIIDPNASVQVPLSYVETLIGGGGGVEMARIK